MLVIAIAFTVLGLLGSLTIALFPTRVEEAFRTMREVWYEARWYEKLAVMLLVAPIPGPFDELVGLLVVRRVIQRQRKRVASIDRQVAEDV